MGIEKTGASGNNFFTYARYYIFSIDSAVKILQNGKYTLCFFGLHLLQKRVKLLLIKLFSAARNMKPQSSEMCRFQSGILAFIPNRN